MNNNILPLTKVLKPSDNEYVQWLKVDPSNLGFGLIIGAAYIPPVDSPYFTGHELEQLSQDIIDISANHNNYNLCVIGDFNSRISNLPDFTVADEHLLRATGLDECLGELFVNEHTLSKLGIPIDRCNADKTIDKNRKKLLDFCKNTGRLIANGRIGTKEKSSRGYKDHQDKQKNKP